MKRNGLSKERILEWAIYLVCVLLFSFFITFSDIKETSLKSFKLIDAILSMNFADNYIPESAFYIPIHMVFAIWNLPVWLITKFTSLEYTSYFSVIWSKIIIYISFFGILKIFKAIFDKLELKNTDHWFILMCLSLLFFTPIFNFSQYDTFGTFFGLLGFYKTIDEEEISVKSLLLMSFASSFKLFFLLTALIIIFIKTKDIKKIIRNILLLFPFVILFYVIHYFIGLSIDDFYKYDLTSNYSYKFFFRSISSGEINIPILFSIFFGIYIYLFEQDKPNSKLDYVKKFSWSSFLLFFSVFIFGDRIHAQWELYLGIYVFMLLAVSDKTDFNTVLYESIFEVALLMELALFWDEIIFSEKHFVIETVANGLIHPFSIDNKMSFGKLIKIYDMENFIELFAALFLVTGIAIIIKTNPFTSKKEKSNTELKDNEINIAVRIKTIALVFYLGMYIVFGFLI